MFILKNLNIEVRRTDSSVRTFILKPSEHVYIEDLNIEAKRSKLILKCESSELVISQLHNIEAKRTGSLVNLYLKLRKKRIFVFFKTKGKKRKCSIMN